MLHKNLVTWDDDYQANGWVLINAKDSCNDVCMYVCMNACMYVCISSWGCTRYTNKDNATQWNSQNPCCNSVHPEVLVGSSGRVVMLWHLHNGAKAPEVANLSVETMWAQQGSESCWARWKLLVGGWWGYNICHVEGTYACIILAPCNCGKEDK